MMSPRCSSYDGGIRRATRRGVMGQQVVTGGDQVVMLGGVICSLLILSSSCAEAFYHLASTRSPCLISGSENHTVDLLCSHTDLDLSHDLVSNTDRGPCQMSSMQWQRVTSEGAMNISESSKTSVWRLREDARSASLMRIHDLQQEDVGSYICRVECEQRDGGTAVRRRVRYHQADVCLKLTDHDLCSVQVSSHSCRDHFWNGVCDPECDFEDRFFDGFDCVSQSYEECPPQLEEICRRDFANGVCDVTCNEMACSWDGGDCIDKPLTLAEDTLVFSLPRWYQTTGKIIDGKLIARNLSRLLHTIVRVLPDDWFGETRSGSDRSWHRPHRADHIATRRLYFKVDRTRCNHRCFHDAQSAAQFITLAMMKGWTPGIYVSSVGVVVGPRTLCDVKNNTLLFGPSKPAQGANAYSSSEHTDSPPLWAILSVVIGGVCIVGLVCVIVAILFKIQNMNNRREEGERIEMQRIHSTDKRDKGPGTDV